MSFSSVRTHRRALWSTVTHGLSLFILVFIVIMPVFTRAQTRRQSNNSSTSIKPVCSTSSLVESLNTTILPEHLTSPVFESLDANPSLVASTSLPHGRLDHIMTDSSFLTIASTSSTPECLNNNVDLPASTENSQLSSSLDPSSLKFQNNFELSDFQIINSLSLVNCESDTYLFPSIINSTFSNNFIMEEDVEHPSLPNLNTACYSKTSQDILDMNDLFSLIKNHITEATQQISGDVRNIAENNAKFKQEVKEELDEMRKVLAEQKRSSNIDSSPSSPSPLQVNSMMHLDTSIPFSVPNTIGQHPSAPVASSQTTPHQAGTTDTQSQLLMMLTESFSKLSTALSEKSDSKSDWPKFSGDGKKFRSWYLAVMAQVSLPPWSEFYDSSRNDVILTTSNTVLNGKLYSKILLALEGMALQSAVSKKYLRANGLALLRDLVQTYRPKNVPEVIALKTGEFWSATKHNPDESIDTYFNRFHELLDDLSEAEEPIPLKSAIRHFIFTLGTDFAAIQNNYRIGRLPDIWKTDD